MKRKYKNIIMIGTLFILIIGTFFTIIKISTYNNRGINNTNMEMDESSLENNRPQRPSNENDNSSMQRPPDKPSTEDDTIHQMPTKGMKNGTSVIGYVLLGSESLLISVLIVYLVLSKFNKNSFKETFISKDKIILYILINIVLCGLLTLTCVYVVNNAFLSVQSSESISIDKNVSEGETVSETEIDLKNYNSNITITNEGSYTITGSFDYSILINSTGIVTLNLNNVTINSKSTASIANISTNELIINLVNDSENNLSDGGKSDYDGCLFSNGPLVIEGEGTLNINGNQNDGEGIATKNNDITINSGTINITSKDDGINAGGDSGGLITINGGSIYIDATGDGIDSNDSLVIQGGIVYTMGSSTGGDAGIDTDNGYKINGGKVIALGNDMMETPLSESTQHSICISMDSAIDEGSLITFLDSNDDVIISFVANEPFKTLIFSSNEISNGEYRIYINGENSGVLSNYIYEGGSYTKGESVLIDDEESFSVKDIITKIEM